MEMLEDKVTKMKEKIVKYGNLIETMLRDCLNGLMDNDEVPLKRVIEELEPVANETEIEIDEMCINAIALYHPEAKHLRLMMMISKMNNDFERMGDMAVNIADSGLYLIARPPVKPLIDLPRMAEDTIQMLNRSMKAFIDEDSFLAVDVLKSDDIVDNLRDQILRELITYMLSDSATIERAMHLLRVARNLERIADLATNIAEDAIYIKEGKVVKHHHNY